MSQRDKPSNFNPLTVDFIFSIPTVTDTMTRNTYVSIGTAGSTTLLLAAFGFQDIADLAPCPLCIWQRWPHAVAIALGVGHMIFRLPLFPWLAAAAVLAGAAIALFHSGVEQQWWEGLQSCAGTPLADMSGSDMLAMTGAISISRCDDVAWSLLGLSMPSWNGLLSLVLTGIWAKAAVQG